MTKPSDWLLTENARIMREQAEWNAAYEKAKAAGDRELYDFLGKESEKPKGQAPQRPLNPLERKLAEVHRIQALCSAPLK